MHDVGVVLFDTITPALLRHPAPMPSMNGAHSDVLEDVRVDHHDSEIPRPLRHVLGDSLDALAWSRVAPGIEQHVVPLSPAAHGDLRLLKMGRGARIPEHGHHGEELSMVLRGACRDALGTYTVGDLLDLDDEVRHEVIAGDASGCILIVGSEGTPAFATSWLD